MLALEELYKADEATSAWPVGPRARSDRNGISAAPADPWLGAVIGGFRLAFLQRLSERDKTAPMRATFKG
jgi:hypothetical protein